MTSSYKEFTTQELEKAAAKVLSQTKRYTYSSNKLQPSDRMQGKKVGGSRRKSNRPSTPSINMSMKTSQQIYNNRQPGQRQGRSSSNSYRRYGSYNSDRQANSKLKLRMIYQHGGGERNMVVMMKIMDSSRVERARERKVTEIGPSCPLTKSFKV